MAEWKHIAEELDLMIQQKLPISGAKIHSLRKELKKLRRIHKDQMVELKKLGSQLSQLEQKRIDQQRKAAFHSSEHKSSAPENKSPVFENEYFNLLYRPQMAWDLGVVVDPFPDRFVGWFFVSADGHKYKAHVDDVLFRGDQLPSLGQMFWFRSKDTNAVQLFDSEQKLDDPSIIPLCSDKIEYGQICFQEADEKHPFVLIETVDRILRIAPYQRSYWLTLNRTSKLLSFPVQFVVRDNVATCVRPILGDFRHSTFHKIPSCIAEAQCIRLDETTMTIQTSDSIVEMKSSGGNLLQVPFRIYYDQSECRVIDHVGKIGQIASDSYTVVSSIDGIKYIAPFTCSISQFKLQDNVKFRLVVYEDSFLAVNLV